MFKKRSNIFDSNFVYFLIICLFVVIRIVSSTFSIGTVWGYILNATIQIGLMLSLPLFLYSYLRKQKIKQTLQQYNFRKISIKSVFVSLIMGVLVYCITIFIATFFSAILSLFGYESSSGGVMSEYPLWLLFVELFFTAVLPGICEEVAHRGMLLSTYKQMGAKKAIVLSGLLFGLMHLNIEQFFYASIIGFFFAFVTLGTDSIYPTMIMHFTNNAISTFMGYASVNKLPISSFVGNLLNSILSSNAFIAIIMIFLIVMLLVCALLFLTKVLFKDVKIKQIATFADDMVKQELRRELLNGIVTEDQENSQPAEGQIEFNSQSYGNKKIFNIIYKNQINSQKPYVSTYKDNIFLYVNMFMGIAITLCTFIWGIL